MASSLSSGALNSSDPTPRRPREEDRDKIKICHTSTDEISSKVRGIFFFSVANDPTRLPFANVSEENSGKS